MWGGREGRRVCVCVWSCRCTRDEEKQLSAAGKRSVVVVGGKKPRDHKEALEGFHPCLPRNRSPQGNLWTWGGHLENLERGMGV